MSEERKARKIRMNDHEWDFFKESLGPEWLRTQIKSHADHGSSYKSHEDSAFALGCAKSIADKLLKSRTIEEVDLVLDASSKLSTAYPSLFSVSYCISQSAILSMKSLCQESADLEGSEEGVYVIKYDSGILKIGRTRFFENRLYQIKNSSSQRVVDSRFFPCDNSSLIEASIHSDLSFCRIKNEFFQCDYEKAIEIVISKTAAA